MTHIIGKFNLIKINDLENFFNCGIFQRDSINKKGTKIEDKNKYIYFIELLKKKFYLEKDDFIIPFFKEKNIFVPEIIINGYIKHELNENDNMNILSLLNKIFPLLFHKKYIFLIYKKLSKIYRKLNVIKDLDEHDINKFTKVFNLWKLFFSYDDIQKLNKKYIFFYGDNYISIDYPFNSNNIILSIINIFLFNSPLFYILNENKNNFSLMKLYYNNKEGNKKEICNIKYNDIMKKGDEDNIKKIQFNIYEDKISCIINDENNIKDIIKFKEKFKYNKIKLLSNFNGKLSYIEIFTKNNNNDEKKIVINAGKNGLNIDIDKEINSNIAEEKIEIKLKRNNNIFYKYYPLFSYENIKYYGGFESFIPILKIFYKLFLFIINGKIKESLNKIKNLYKSYFKILIDISNFSELNLKNFFEIIFPLTASLSEINEIIPYPEIKKEIYKDNYFINLFILIAISPCSINIKRHFQKIFSIEINKINFVLLDFKNNEKILLKYNNSLDWFSFMIFLKIEFILLVSDDVNKIPKGFISALINIYNSLENNINIVKNLSEKKKSKIKSMIELFCAILNVLKGDKIKFPNNFKIIKDYDLLNFIQGFESDKNDIILIIFKIIKFMFIINKCGYIKFGENNKNTECYFSKFYILFLSLKGIFRIKNSNNEDNKKIFEEIMKYFPENKSLILEILDENKEINFIKDEENIIDDFIDLHGQYRHLIKELFIFNRPWSNQKSFFGLDAKYKYKNINYYTSNFQRPLLYPILDYESQYPKFSNFKINNNFYLKKDKENSNLSKEYNFDFYSKELDELNDKSNLELIKNISNKYIENIQIYNTCLVKRTHHIKGKLFIILIGGFPKKIYFCGFSNIVNKNEKLCNGALFNCPLKDKNRKIYIKLRDIRLIIRRIYYNKRTGIEIFTKNKSYYFNFCENDNGQKVCEIIINLLVYYWQNNFYPINIDGNIIGYSKIFFNSENIQENNDLIFIKNKYINELINHWIKKDKINNIEKTLSSFDALIYLNLLSNRSYNDIYQYPIFPLLFFYDINDHNKIERDLENHIGFQVNSKKSEKRKNNIINTFNSKKEEIENGLNQDEIPFYFESNFSNVNYICNYLIRIIPYTFISLELQGDGFDTQNLFNSVEETFYNISYKENDLRELIPEFFYFPEMFININKLNLHKINNKFNDVELPQEFLVYKNKDNINNSFYFYCRFVSNMRENLEKNFLTVFKWKDLIFGKKQKFLNNLEKYILFRPETYISFSPDKDYNNIINKESKYNIEFGIQPLQILEKEEEIELIKVNKKLKINKDCNKNLAYIKNAINKHKNITDDEIIDLSFSDINILINRFIPKIDISIEGKLYKQFYENISSINYFYFNKRLNMFIISSIDGFLLLYVLPGKLINVIKHPKDKSFFNLVFLGSNPFPCIIAFDEQEKYFYSFSINGLFINKICLNDYKHIKYDEDKNIKIYPIFDDENGIYKDFIIVQVNNEEKVNIEEINMETALLLNIPFFERIEISDILL